MNIFGVGIPEILVVLLLAAVIFGPGKLPEIAGQFGRAIRELREYARDFRDEYLTDFEEVREELLEQRFEFQQLDSDIRADLQQAEADIRGAVRDAETMTEDAIVAARDGATPPAPQSASSPAQSTTSASATSEQVTSTPGERRARRVRRRPVLRQRAGTTSDGSSADRTEREAPARPSNVISLNRRRRELDTDQA